MRSQDELLAIIARAPEWRPADIMGALELLTAVFPPLHWAITGIVPEGLTLLAGKPKLGKSWLVLAVCVAIALGGRALSSIPVEAGDVLYLALEDNPRRLQDRLKLLVGDGPAPARLECAVRWPRLDEGGLERIGAWLRAHPDARLIAIDTFKRVRPPKKRHSIYDDDYESLQPLAELAASHRVPIVVVYHSRKADGEDVLDELSGSTGLAAAADGVLILRRERGQADAVLHVVHREGEEQELALTWHPDTAMWAIAGNAEEYRVSKERRKTLDVLEKAGKALTPTEIAERTGETVGAVKTRMSRMVDDDQVVSTGDGKYTTKARADTCNSRNPRNPADDQTGDEPAPVTPVTGVTPTGHTLRLLPTEDGWEDVE